MTDPDFWWAVLGGGGGVYGVVTQFVLKLHPAPDGFVEFYIQFQIADSGNCAGVATEVSIGADITSHAVPDICKVLRFRSTRQCRFHTQIYVNSYNFLLEI